MRFGEGKTRPKDAPVQNQNQKSTSSPNPLSLDDIKRLQRELMRYLLLRGRPPIEGSSTPEQLLYLASTVHRTGARLIGEIGFNAGFSSYAFLSAHPEAKVISFDLGKRACTKVAKKLIDLNFPNRHELIYGDSRETVPEFTIQNPDVHFDLVFIDGGHEYDVAKADIANMMPLCTDKTFVIMDDLMPWRHFGTGPTQAWTEATQVGIIRQDELIKDGKPADVIAPPGKRSWALGQYIFA
jgi:predicted O-methyltransferase YrrM